MRNLKTYFSAIAVALGMAPNVYIQAVNLRNLSTPTTPYAVLFGNWHQLIQPAAELAALFPQPIITVLPETNTLVSALFGVNPFQACTVPHAVWQFIHTEQLRLANGYTAWWLAQADTGASALSQTKNLHWASLPDWINPDMIALATTSTPAVRLGFQLLNLAYQANLIGELNIAASFTNLARVYLIYLQSKTAAQSAHDAQLTGAAQRLVASLASALLTLYLADDQAESVPALSGVLLDQGTYKQLAPLGRQLGAVVLHRYQQHLYQTAAAKHLPAHAPHLLIDPAQFYGQWQQVGELAAQLVGLGAQSKNIGPVLALLELINFGPLRLVTAAPVIAVVQQALTKGFKRYYAQLQQYVQYELAATELVYLTDKRPRVRQAYRIKRKALGKASNKSLKLADTNAAYQQALIGRGLPVWGVIRYLAYPEQLIGTLDLRSRFKPTNPNTNARTITETSDLPPDIFGNQWVAQGRDWQVHLSAAGQAALGSLSVDGQILQVSFDGQISA